MERPTLPPGTAPIKPEFLLSTTPTTVPDDDAAEGITRKRNDPIGSATTSTVGPQRSKTKEDKKAKRGANKGRRFQKVRDEVELCWRIANGEICDHGESCRFTHDIDAYLAVKPRDISIPANISEIPPFVQGSQVETMVDAEHPSIDTTTYCPIFEEFGQCRYGFKCRFLGGHVLKNGDGQLLLTKDEARISRSAVAIEEMNFVSGDILKALRSRKYPFPIADQYLKEIQQPIAQGPSNAFNEIVLTEPEQYQEPEPLQAAPADVIASRTGGSSFSADTPDVPIRFAEKTRLNWSGKTYLAPLTTVGNLPFRRLCVDWGVDITCGEMGLATSFLGGSKEEWSLVRRHPSESVFGIQLAGNKPHTLVPTAEVIGKEFGKDGVDFVDINCGCPIDLVYKAGSGSALLDSANKLGRIITGMNRALGEIPVTVKLRTGVKDGHNNAHKIMPRLASEWGAGCITLHGRTRQQRYTKLADWEYIKTCVAAVRAREADQDLPSVPIFGGGDCYSSQDYWEKVENYGVDGVMVGRGALIKPWIFTEIKERREWDISANERLEGIRKYAEYGLSHFGCDTAGVGATRRYLCEALSFQYRYIPIGLLERLPGRLNERAPSFQGRNALETLLASPDSNDWVKISEMFLGPAPESWSFTPKHKSNSYESQG